MLLPKLKGIIHRRITTLNGVFEMQAGEVFGVAPEFMPRFIANIPDDRFFKFTAITENSAEYKKYGSNCYKVLCNEKVINM